MTSTADFGYKNKLMVELKSRSLIAILIKLLNFLIVGLFIQLTLSFHQILQHFHHIKTLHCVPITQD